MAQLPLRSHDTRRFAVRAGSAWPQKLSRFQGQLNAWSSGKGVGGVKRSVAVANLCFFMKEAHLLFFMKEAHL